MPGLNRIAIGLLLLLLATPAAAEVLDDFEQGLGPSWEVKSFHGETRYRVVAEADDGGYCLRADCQQSASGLFLEREYRLQDQPWLSWRWKIDHVLPGGDARLKSGDDYAARIYVVFPHWFLPKTRTINYIWANRLPQGESIASPYTDNSQMVAVRSGAEQAGRWKMEKRNVLEDYRRLFGEEPPPVGAIAVMTDADNTAGEVTAWYDDICISAE